MPKSFQALKGTFDVLPPGSARYERLAALFAEHVHTYGFQLIVQPLIEEIGVFQRIGDSTDIVTKEMYDFRDKGDRHIALRPEATAAVARAYIEHRPTPPWKVWYVTPKFRYEQPQAGRYRQHHEVGLEALGTDDPDLDVEVIALASRFYAALGLRRLTLRLTSLGDAQCRPAYRDELIAYLTARRDELCEEHRDRIELNPLRILDCKRSACITATVDAPRLLDRLCPECAHHFERVTAGLDALDVPYSVDRSLVRGLDYYTRTTFEFMAEAIDSAQNGAGGGGRYDALVESLGGPATPGIGFGLGIERILLACDAEGVFGVEQASRAVDVFVIATIPDNDDARDVTDELRRAGVAADRAFDGRSFKAQMKIAMRSGARYAVVLDPERIELRTLTEKGEAETLERSTLVDHVKKRLGA